MPNTTFRLLKWSAAGMISAVFMWACDNDPASIGLDTLPATDVLNANSVSTNFYGVQTQPERVASDHMAVNQPRLPLGELNDPLAGYTRADFVTQINLGEKTPVFRYDALTDTVDEAKFSPVSLELNLVYRYEDWLGDPNAVQTIQVYEVTEHLPKITSLNRYHSDFELEGKIAAEPLGEIDFSPRKGLTEEEWQKKNYLDTISINLGEELLERIFNLPEEKLQTREAFQNELKGLYVTVKPELSAEKTGALVRFDLNLLTSNMTLHFQKVLREITNDGEEGDTLQIEPKSYLFPINKEVVYFSRYEHQPLNGFFLDDPEVTHLLVQGMGGPMARLDLAPLISQWTDSLAQQGDLRYGISGVDLVLRPDTTPIANLHFPYSQTLNIARLNERGNPVFPIATRTEEGDTLAIFNNQSADYDAETNSFTFRMNQHFFETAAKGNAEVPPLYLVLPNMQFNFNRLRLYNRHPDFGPVLKVKYVSYPSNETQQ